MSKKKNDYDEKLYLAIRLQLRRTKKRVNQVHDKEVTARCRIGYFPKVIHSFLWKKRQVCSR